MVKIPTKYSRTLNKVEIMYWTWRKTVAEIKRDQIEREHTAKLRAETITVGESNPHYWICKGNHEPAESPIGGLFCLKCGKPGLDKSGYFTNS